MSEVLIRAAQGGDEAVVYALLRELAEYERLDHRFRLTPEIIRREFLCSAPCISCELGFLDAQAAGIMTWYRTYSSFAAQRGIYLEDFYVQPALRRRGIGRELLAHLARRAVAEGANLIQWAVLAWNEPTIRFYESLQAQRVDEWHVYRLTGAALENLARP